jgi:hypothetical protein
MDEFIRRNTEYSSLGWHLFKDYWWVYLIIGLSIGIIYLMYISINGDSLIK